MCLHRIKELLSSSEYASIASLDPTRYALFAYVHNGVWLCFLTTATWATDKIKA